MTRRLSSQATAKIIASINAAKADQVATNVAASQEVIEQQRALAKAVAHLKGE